jgi:hypothetical protein
VLVVVMAIVLVLVFLSLVRQSCPGNWTILVGGLEHVLFFHILGMSSSQLTNMSPNIFQRGRSTSNQNSKLKHSWTLDFTQMRSGGI